ncbi:MAG: hypothetical protein RBR59_00720 [Sulfurimonadaceae bacterium]|jgi:hypothetical protein|nr:hypothetical protein [Sulfurimonadaceae bacterium]
MWVKIIFSIIFLALLVLNFSFTIGEHAMELHQLSFERAMMAFGLAKGLNGVISLLQGTQLSVTPVGVGLTFSIGEILDPINDLVEQFSWVMLFASISLGVQKLLLIMSGKFFMQVIVVVSLALSFIFLWVKKLQTSIYFVGALKFLVLVLFLRFGAFLFVYSSEYIYLNLLAQDYHESTQVIEQTTTSLEEIQKTNRALIAEKKEEGFFDKLSSNYNSLMENLNFSKQIQSLQDTLEEATKKIINLITIFVVLSVLMPLLYFTLFIVGIKYVFRIKIEEAVLYKIFNQEKNRV